MPVHHAAHLAGPDPQVLAPGNWTSKAKHTLCFNLFLPLQEILCQLTSASQSAFVFFSSFSVVAIAVDRLLFIAYPKKTQITTGQVIPCSYVTPLLVY